MEKAELTDAASLISIMIITLVDDRVPLKVYVLCFELKKEA